MKVRYIYSACIEIETRDARILTDPWFTPGAYDGAWHQFPVIEEPLDVLREPDLVYISHIHPDHYDPIFLLRLFDKYGPKPVIIPEFDRNFLALKTKSDGIDAQPTKELAIGATKLHIVPNIIPSESDIDSALIVHGDGHTALNLNDCLWNPPHVEQVQSLVSSYTDELDLLALGYTGAGPFPQTYFDLTADREQLLAKADEKKQNFFARYRRYAEAFPAKWRLPFAGKYVLGGKLAPLNPYRGVADPVEVAAFDDHARVLDDAGRGEIDLETGAVSALRETVYDEEALAARTAELADLPLDRERDFTLPYEKINFARLLRTAYAKARKRSEMSADYWFTLNIQDEIGIVRDRYFFNTFTDEFERLTKDRPLPEPRSDIYIDYRQLFGLLTGVYHWNNAEVGSLFFTRRHPVDHFDRYAQSFLNFLCAA